jgi:peptidoglycan/xylan/chitin deacetylase (PgdA/CDA1 family)
VRAPSKVASALFRLGGDLSSRAYSRQRSLVILIYHRVLAEPDPLRPWEPDARLFATQLDLLAEHFNVLPLQDAAARLRAGTLPARALCITFDDGYADNFTIALPVLKARALPATVFVAPGYLDGGRMFNDTVIETVRLANGTFDLRHADLERYELGTPAAKLAAIEQILGRIKYLDPRQRLECAKRIGQGFEDRLPTDLMMTRTQVQQLHAAGVEIGAHTMMHPILTRVGRAEAHAEILQSKRSLESITGAPVVSFAYPNGRPQRDYEREHVEIVRECQFEQAVSTAAGAASSASDSFQLPRVAPWDNTAHRYLARLMLTYRQLDAAVV